MANLSNHSDATLPSTNPEGRVQSTHNNLLLTKHVGTVLSLTPPPSFVRVTNRLTTSTMPWTPDGTNAPDNFSRQEVDANVPPCTSSGRPQIPTKTNSSELKSDRCSGRQPWLARSFGWISQRGFTKHLSRPPITSSDLLCQRRRVTTA